MAETRELNIIARIRSDFTTKFGVPRQSGLVDALESTIVFEPEYRNEDALRGLEDFSHIWLIWQFSQSVRQDWSPTVRPPRLGGNRRVGVFATRSPFRPNDIGMSVVKLECLYLPATLISEENDEKYNKGQELIRYKTVLPEGPQIIVSGVDLMDGTPIYDIKPYIKYADARPEAVCGYVDSLEERSLKVVFPSELSAKITDGEIIPALVETLRLDPRPSYHDDPHRAYGLSFAGYNVRFHVFGNVLEVSDVSPIE